MKRMTVILGDGIGPEVVNAALRIIRATGVNIDAEICEAGGESFKKGIETGVPQETIDSIARTKIVLKGPLETPIGYGNKSANVTMRKLFETFGNIRPVRELPGVATPYSGRKLDIVVVRENVEDLYAGIEYMQTPGVAESLKLISKKGCEKIVRLAFEFAKAEGRKRIHCATKANIMKLSEGLLQHTFLDIAKEYPGIEARHILVDNCAHQLAMRPEQFDIIVTTNMNGDILSDLTSGLTGGLGFAPSANIGNDVSMFEAVHGSAPDIAGKDLANPTALILSAVMLLRRIGEGKTAEDVEQAVLYTLESGARTGDMKGSSPALGTTAYTDLIISNLGKRSGTPSREFHELKLPPKTTQVVAVPVDSRKVVGVDIYVESTLQPGELGSQLETLAKGSPLKLEGLANRGTTVYPAETTPDVRVALVDHYRARFVGDVVDDKMIIDLLSRLSAHNLNWGHVEKLHQFNGADAFSKSQG